MAPRVDWFRLILAVERTGIDVNEISRRIDVPFETVRGWRNQGAEPRYSAGDRLVRLWREATLATDEPPERTDRGVSVGRAKA